MKAEQYLKRVAKTVYDSKIRNDIRQELQDTLDDMIESYEEEGMSRSEAEAEAVRQMGDPVEVGNMFNIIYRPEFEWKAAICILICSLVIGGLNIFGILSTALGAEGYSFAFTILGAFFIFFGFILSAAERYMDLPFFYAYAKNWGTGGLGSVGNSLTFCGIGIGLLSKTLLSLLITYTVVTFIILVQRSAIVKSKNLKEQKYLYETCTALEDFNYRGKTKLNGKTVKVQISRGQTAAKDDLLLVVGMDGFTLIVENM